MKRSRPAFHGGQSELPGKAVAPEQRGAAIGEIETVLITGAAGGLGEVIAHRCAKLGYRLVLADINEQAGLGVSSALAKDGAAVRFVRLDLSDPGSIDAMARSVEIHEGRIHGLVNNGALASGLGGKRFEDETVEVWDRVMAVNVRGTWLCTRAVSPMLVDRRARVVNIASDTALWGQTHLLAYVASKGAVISMSKSLARELGPRGIGVFAVAPGLMVNAATAGVPAERHTHYEQNRAAPGAQKPEEIVGVITFCLSTESLPMTGQTLLTNAGFYIN